MLIRLIAKNAQPMKLGIRQFLTSGDITHFCHKTLLYSPLPGSPHWLVDYEGRFPLSTIPELPRDTHGQFNNAQPVVWLQRTILQSINYTIMTNHNS